jgi:hypothetical protein
MCISYKFEYNECIFYSQIFKNILKIKLNIFDIIKHNNSIFRVSVFKFQDCYSQNKDIFKQQLKFRIFNFQAV